MTDLAREYASGLYELAQEEKLSSEILSQMQALKLCFREQPDFCRLLCNMSISKEERLSILDNALRGQVHPYLLNFLKILLERGALNEYEGCLNAFRALYNEAHGIIEAAVTTSAPLSDDQRRRLKEKLLTMTGREVELTEKLDPSVIDGVLLEMNGQRFDNTIRRRLQSIHSVMAGEG